MRIFALAAATMALTLMNQEVNDLVDSLDHDDYELTQITSRARRYNRFKNYRRIWSNGKLIWVKKINRDGSLYPFIGLNDIVKKRDKAFDEFKHKKEKFIAKMLKPVLPKLIAPYNAVLKKEITVRKAWQEYKPENVKIWQAAKRVLKPILDQANAAWARSRIG